MEKKEVNYRAIKACHFDESFLIDYLEVFNDAFGSYQIREAFEKKYCDNIYGSSILVVAYVDGIPVGADSLWRNDINGKIAYQSADTCVKHGYRGLGIFKGLVATKLSYVEPEALVYGFPNVNSYPGFMKMGWNLVAEYRPCLLTSLSAFKAEHKMKIDREYAKYWFNDDDKYGVFKRSGSEFLVKRRGRLPIYSIIGEIEKDAATLFKIVNMPFLLLYKSSKHKWYNNNKIPTRVITLNQKCDIPIWKLDAI